MIVRDSHRRVGVRVSARLHALVELFREMDELRVRRHIHASRFYICGIVIGSRVDALESLPQSAREIFREPGMELLQGTCLEGSLGGRNPPLRPDGEGSGLGL